MKVEVKDINGIETSINVPATWRDVTWAKFIEFEMCEGSQLDKLALLCGVSKSVLEANIFFTATLIQVCEFAFTSDLTDYSKTISSKFKSHINVQIGSEKWGKLEACKKALQEVGNKQYKAAYKVIKEYTEIDINEEPCTEAIGLVAFFLPNWIASLRGIKH